MKKLTLSLACFLLIFKCFGQQNEKFNGLDMNLGTLSRLSDAKTRSISPENFTGEKVKAAWPIR
ncbi:hypothetical protein [Mucilaginibacter humi]|uniref:hypothetical protein n=1 Tax=Mucilaginibacter humi TaxID=2732510 RepID=UPI001C2EB70D|nr:hypothetical protein [Mucilaginibacter humi]